MFLRVVKSLMVHFLDPSIYSFLRQNVCFFWIDTWLHFFSFFLLVYLLILKYNKHLYVLSPIVASLCSFLAHCTRENLTTWVFIFFHIVVRTCSLSILCTYQLHMHSFFLFGGLRTYLPLFVVIWSVETWSMDDVHYTWYCPKFKR